MENFWQLLVDRALLIGILLIIMQLIVLIIGYLMIDTTCEYDLEHPILTFFILLFFGVLGFFVELFRNAAVDNVKRRNAALMDSTKKIARALEKREHERIVTQIVHSEEKL